MPLTALGRKDPDWLRLPSPRWTVPPWPTSSCHKSSNQPAELLKLDGRFPLGANSRAPCPGGEGSR